LASGEAERARFEDAGAQLVGITVDSRHGAHAWAQSLGGINYPVLSDFWPHGGTALRYGVLRPDGRAQRSLFVVDKEGIVRYIDVHAQGEQPDYDAVLEALQEIG